MFYVILIILAVVVGAGLFFLNPLVLYNGPFYGRFDSLCLAALLLAWRQLEPEPVRGRRLALWYSLGVTLKTFPLFLLLGQGAITALAAPLRAGSADPAIENLSVGEIHYFADLADEVGQLDTALLRAELMADLVRDRSQ